MIVEHEIVTKLTSQTSLNKVVTWWAQFKKIYKDIIINNLYCEYRTY